MYTVHTYEYTSISFVVIVEENVHFIGHNITELRPRQSLFSCKGEFGKICYHHFPDSNSFGLLRIYSSCGEIRMFKTLRVSLKLLSRLHGVIDTTESLTPRGQICFLYFYVFLVLYRLKLFRI